MASAVEMLSGRRKRDYAAEAAADALAAQAHALGASPDADDETGDAATLEADEAGIGDQEELVAA